MKKFFLLASLLLAACTNQIFAPSDGGPRGNVDVNSIPDAIVKPVTRTAAGNKSPYTVLGKTYAVLDDSRGYVAEGTASWYGSKFHGRNTSNGEVFNMYDLTAAHKHLPIPTYAEITNLENGRKVTVRINDRGPFHGDRVIDLSWAAAAKLGYSDKGTARVRIVTLDPATGSAPGQVIAQERPPARVPVPAAELPPAPQPQAIPAPELLPQNSYYQVAALSDRFDAAGLARDIEALTKYPVVIDWDEADVRPLYKILVGPLQDNREVGALSTVLGSSGLRSGFLVQLARSNSATDISNL